MNNYKVKEMAENIQRLRHCAEELKQKSDGIQAVERNVERILACIKMLELNISDVSELYKD